MTVTNGVDRAAKRHMESRPARRIVAELMQWMSGHFRNLGRWLPHPSHASVRSRLASQARGTYGVKIPALDIARRPDRRDSKPVLRPRSIETEHQSGFQDPPGRPLRGGSEESDQRIRRLGLRLFPFFFF